jgi:hypothetical protein
MTAARIKPHRGGMDAFYYSGSLKISNDPQR